MIRYSSDWPITVLGVLKGILRLVGLQMVFRLSLIFVVFGQESYSNRKGTLIQHFLLASCTLFFPVASHPGHPQAENCLTPVIEY